MQDERRREQARHAVPCPEDEPAVRLGQLDTCLGGGEGEGAGEGGGEGEGEGEGEPAVRLWQLGTCHPLDG